MKIKEFFSNRKLWNEIDSKKEFPFIDENTDNLFILQHGELEVYSPIEKKTTKEVAEMILSLYTDKWNNIINVEKDINLGAKESTKREETNNETGESTNNNSTKHNVTAYNSDELILDNEDKGKEQKQNTKDIERTVKSHSLSAKAFYDNLTFAEQTNIVNLAFQDAVNVIAITVY